MAEPLGPKFVDVDNVRYNYKRALVEHLMCETCGSMFITHVATGKGAFFVQDHMKEKDACPGCQEILREQEITMPDWGRPS
jgi:hypothetical protein